MKQGEIFMNKLQHRKDIVRKDVFDDYADKIRDNPKKLKEFENAVNQAYLETGDIEVLLTALSIIAKIRNTNKTTFAKKANIGRRTIYNLFSKNANPTLKNLSSVASTLGVGIKLSFGQLSRHKTAT
jgi:probable addiction module antidote protein